MIYNSGEPCASQHVNRYTHSIVFLPHAGFFGVNKHSTFPRRFIPLCVCVSCTSYELWFEIISIKLCMKYFLNNLGQWSQWTFQRKMNFNPHPNKQAVEVILSRQCDGQLCLAVYFITIHVKWASDHKHFDLVLDSQLTSAILSYSHPKL